MLTRGNNQTLTVEGGGVNATVIQPNIAATNGFVHIIDRVLGVPYTTVFEKLKTDPMLKWVDIAISNYIELLIDSTPNILIFYFP